jgi:hypothetical protein
VARRMTAGLGKAQRTELFALLTACGDALSEE